MPVPMRRTAALLPLTLFLKPNPTVTYASMARTAHTGNHWMAKTHLNMSFNEGFRLKMLFSWVISLCFREIQDYKNESKKGQLSDRSILLHWLSNCLNFQYKLQWQTHQSFTPSRIKQSQLLADTSWPTSGTHTNLAGQASEQTYTPLAKTLTWAHIVGMHLNTGLFLLSSRCDALV